MSSDDRQPDDECREPGWMWTAPQRRVLAVFLVVLCPVLAIRYACNRAYVPDPPPTYGPRYDEVADKIDPNTADVAMLSALPLIGEKKAQDIVAHREARRAASPDRLVFSRAEDLLQIRGFGHATVETLRPYLMFPAPQSTATTRAGK